jgi:hypothetical protein
MWSDLMLICTSWKARPLSPEQSQRMMALWGTMEAEAAADPNWERLCWYLYLDGSGGFSVDRVADTDAAAALALEQSLALGEFLELDVRPVSDLESAMPAIMAAMERAGGG